MSAPIPVAINGFPDGAQMVEIQSREAARARDLALHLSDLTFCKGALDQIPRATSFIVADLE